jgi:hypothetical protein
MSTKVQGGNLKAPDHQFTLLMQIGAVLRSFPHMPLGEALTIGQIASKKWLIRELEALDLSLGTVFVLGGWWGILPAMMFESRLRFDKIRSFDLDPSCAPVADTINRSFVMDQWKFKAATADMTKMQFTTHHYEVSRADGSKVQLQDSPDTLVNTSCEHLPDFSAWWDLVPAGKLLVLQSNDFFLGNGHCNSVESLEALERQAPLAQTLFRGELQLPDYRRFMLIGRK